jgi:hypothetical protein
MDVALLIDSIVRQTTVLIAQLATSAGTRAPLSHTANQVFLDLVSELKAQGLGHKVIADMFGLALRTYHARVRRLRESSTFRGRSLWAALLEYVQEQDTVRRPALLSRFKYDDEVTVKGVLNDLVDSGLLFRSGRGDETTYRAARAEDNAAELPSGSERLEHLLWVAIHRFGPVSRPDINDVVPADARETAEAIERLVEQGKVVREESAGIVRYRSDHCLIGLHEPAGWEAAVFDHYQAVVTAIGAKLSRGKRSASEADVVGGSTYHYDVWPGHPHYERAHGHLAALRALSVSLREEIEAYNQKHGLVPEDQLHRVVAYVGQSVREPEGEFR